MKLTHALSGSVIAGVILLSATACSPAKDETNKPVYSASATTTATATVTPSEIPVATTTATTQGGSVAEAPVISDSPDVETIAVTLGSYYEFVASAGALDKVKEAVKALPPDPSGMDPNQVAAGFTEGYKYFDTSSSKNVSNAISELYARTTQSERKPGATVSVPAEAITVKGNTATVDASKILVTVNGVTGPSTKSPYFEMAEINLVKKADGLWGMIPEAPRQSIP